MVKCLLACHFETNKEYFDGNKSKAQLVAAWRRTALLFNLKMMIAIEVPKLKNKFQAVKSEFSTLRWSMDNKTGNATERLFDLPTYWDSLVEHFGDKTGLGHHEFGTSDPPPPAKSVDDTSTVDGLRDDVTNVDDTCHGSNGLEKRKLEVQLEMQRQRERRKKGKIDVASGLVSMGEIMAKGWMLQPCRTTVV
ncbi:hypothetical protein H257_15662 [Aphanomyces astaci]|uniref:Myb/SANT-like domain-containing protein n=1 Tax=Aphanomyces astaci TaxID=112090 RepID=W4FNB9_APHAT|nr:hypothetical protein H257_15662 [Aphanomyces astaci]ETV68339.1 hypothetical protein H257_15662 [Aphanomyces astaci]RQM30476.1 hypothetical protein B5M09_013390 [Aphanomyces astaci]|eukprot:XP_009842134.1 hypothetical protein H257_15662 [Aphanomyces astaci]